MLCHSYCAVHSVLAHFSLFFFAKTLVFIIFIWYKTAKIQLIYRGYSTKDKNIYLLAFSYFTNINPPSSLFLQFYKSNYKHPGYNLEIKEADPGYTTVSTIDFNQLKHN